MDKHAEARIPTTAPRPAHCPPWCADCSVLDPPGTRLHRSPPATVGVYDEACEPGTVHVRAAFWDKAPEWIGTDPADLERPHVEVDLPGDADVQLYLTPQQAHSLAAALVRAAEAASTEAVHRPPAGSRGASAATIAGAPNSQA